MNITDYIFFTIIAIIIFFADFLSVRWYIRTNKDLFWVLYHNEIMKEFKEFDKNFWEEEDFK